jgi:serine/threonine-protein kinase ATR
MHYTIYDRLVITSRGSSCSFSPTRLRNSLSTRGSFEASQVPRDAVVEKLSNLISVLTRCEDVQCTGETRYIDVFALSDIIESVLRGPAGQVTAADHQRAYNTLRHGIRHYSDGTSFHEWSRTSEVVFKGVINKDRSIRLAAG